jgi:hypothetical protein
MLAASSIGRSIPAMAKSAAAETPMARAAEAVTMGVDVDEAAKTAIGHGAAEAIKASKRILPR